MKNIKNNFIVTILISSIFSFFTCTEDINSNIKGQAIIGNSNSSVNYSPKGKFIQIIKPDSGIWKNLILKQKNKEIEPKIFFLNDDVTVSILYDRLNLGEYELKYISELNDTIKEKLNLKNSIKIEFPDKLNKFYTELNIKNLDINNLKASDTLQLLYQSYGCFGGSESLIEFIIRENNDINYRLQIDGLPTIKESGDLWTNSNDLDIRKELANFITKAGNLVKTDFDLCSSDMNYIFRIKGTNIISIVEDKSCQLSDEIDELLNQR